MSEPIVTVKKRPGENKGPRYLKDVKDLTYGFTENTQTLIKTKFKELHDIEKVCRIVFGKEADMRSDECKRATAFIQYHCTADPKLAKPLPISVLTEEHKRRIDELYVHQDVKKLTEILKILFPDQVLAYFNTEYQAVRSYLEEKYDYRSIYNRKPAPEKKGLKAVVEKINASIESEYLDFHKLSSIQKKQAESLMFAMNSARWQATYTSYETRGDRELFEKEFIRGFWDKPDLNVDEINLLITVCDNYVLLLKNRERADKLQQTFHESEGNDLSMKLTEAIISVNSERHDIEKRIETTVKLLNGSRSERINKRGENRANLNALFEAFKQQDERKRLLAITALQRQPIEKEVNRLESAEEYLARIVGITKNSVL